MNRRKEILDELKEYAPSLAGMDIQNPYTVPAGYFEALPELVMLRIRTENAGSAKEELEMISPLLGGLSKKMPFTVPDGYFESIEPGIHVARKERKPARVVKMFQPQTTFRYAAAAVIAGIIGIAAWLFIRQPSLQDNEFAVKPDTEVQKELKSKVRELSENELANFTEVSPLIINYENNTNDEIDESDVRMMLADIPDQDLEKYIDQNTVKEKYN